MDNLKATSSRLGRWIIAVLDIVLLLVIITWAVWASRMIMQFVFIVAVFALGLLAGLSAAAWRHGFRWFFSRCALRFYGWLIVGSLSVLVLFYAEETWRGKRAWAALQREAAARGDSLELSSVFPPPVPDDQNMLLAPGMPELVATNRLPFYHGAREKWPTASASWAFQQPVDLAAWQRFVRQHPVKASTPTNDNVSRLAFPVAPEPQTPAADVLLALSRYEPDLAILRAAAQRPGARYSFAYEDGWFALSGSPSPTLENIFSAAHFLCLRAVAELAQNQNEAALQDTLLALRLADSLRQEPYAVVQSIRTEMLMFCLQPVWEGLTSHRWNEAQVVALQQRLAQMDLLADFRVVARGETILMMNLADQLLAFLQNRRSTYGDRIKSGEEGEPFWVGLFRVAYPVGWLYQDKAWMYRFYERRADALKAVDPANEMSLESELRRATDPLLLIMAVPRLKEVLSDGASKALYLQTTFQEAVVACALERYRLAQGHYPDALGALVPNWLSQVPADLLDSKGGPLKYRRDADGGFVLYSVGLNRADDHGTPGPIVESSRRDWRGVEVDFPPLHHGDWVWVQPGKP
jgi:hypothetical protein